MKKILIVDDLSQNLYMLEVLLKTNGFEVETATNGIEALEVAQKNLPELIISDILMPGMDGFSLIHAWKTNERLKNIPFIFYTATYTNLKDEKLAIGLGADAYLVKPMETEAFLKEIQKVLQNQESKKPSAQPIEIEKEIDFYKEYNQALVRKLEDKMLQLQKSNNRLAALYKISSEMHTTKQFSDQICLILQSLTDVGGYQYANYFTFNENQTKLHLLSSIGFSEATTKKIKEELVVAIGEPKGMVGLVAQNGQVVNIGNTSKEANWIPFDPRIKSVVYVPVYYKKVLLGVIAVYSTQTNAFTEEDERDITSLANNLAIAIENNRNQEQVLKQLNRISALHNIDLAIKSSVDLSMTLNIFLNHVTKLLRVDAADVLLSKPFATGYEFAAAKGFNTSLIENDSIRRGKSLDKKVAAVRDLVIADRLSGEENTKEFITMWNTENFSVYFGVPLQAKGQVVGVLEVFNRSYFNPDPEWVDFFVTLAGQAAIAIDNTRLFNDLQQSTRDLFIAYDETIKGWSRAMDLRDKESEEHTERVTKNTIQLAGLMGVSEENIIQIRRGSLLHDIGKLGIPDSILFKAGALTDEEITILRKHPQIAFDLLQPIDYLRPALEIPYSHHERWDGTGYPRGLKGEEIPLSARIFAVVHVWDSLLTDRPYRKAWPETKIIAYLLEQKGKYFDPYIVDKFLSLKKEIASS
jgi:response regulator RpfG family c-di-GMP phosphodiesterase